jgi:hypothetical protein
MYIRIPKIIIGNDLCGMIMAPILGAVFVPVAFVPSFAWEYLDEEVEMIKQLRNSNWEFPYILKYVKKFPFYRRKIDEFYSINLENNKIIDVKCFYWEIERWYHVLLLQAGLLWDNFTGLNSCQHEILDGKNILKLPNLTIEFETCWILNAGDHFFQSDVLEPVQQIKSSEAHILAHLRIRKETDDAKGIAIPCDLLDIKEQSFNKIWYSRPFGRKHVQFAPSRGKTIKTTKDIVFIYQNIPLEEIEQEDSKYSFAEIRGQIFRFLAPYKRINERAISFDKFINLMTLSTNIDLYEDTENLKFLYIDDKSDLICKKNLEETSWPVSSQRILYQVFKEAYRHLSTGTPMRKILF